jgi:hypothetical protein
MRSDDLELQVDTSGKFILEDALALIIHTDWSLAWDRRQAA